MKLYVGKTFVENGLVRFYIRDRVQLRETISFSGEVVSGRVFLSSAGDRDDVTHLQIAILATQRCRVRKKGRRIQRIKCIAYFWNARMSGRKMRRRRPRTFHCDALEFTYSKAKNMVSV